MTVYISVIFCLYPFSSILVTLIIYLLTLFLPHILECHSWFSLILDTLATTKFHALFFRHSIYKKFVVTPINILWHCRPCSDQTNLVSEFGWFGPSAPTISSRIRTSLNADSSHVASNALSRPAYPRASKPCIDLTARQWVCKRGFPLTFAGRIAFGWLRLFASQTEFGLRIASTQSIDACGAPCVSKLVRRLRH